MSARARRAAVLALVAAVLLSNSLYVGLAFGDGGESRSPTVYVATAVDPANASDHGTLVETVGEDDVVATDSLANANEYAFYGDEYAAPAAAAAVLERAIGTGNASTSDPDTAFTLRRVTASYYAVVSQDEGPPYYRIEAETDGGTTTVGATEVDNETVAQYLVHRDARLYSSLPEYQRNAVDNALDAGDAGYRPADGDSLAELRGRVLVKDDTAYVLRRVGHVDSFGVSPKGVASLVLSGLGTLAFLVAVVLTGLAYRGTSGN